jgi:uncharacterized membrane protein YgcG
MPQLASNVLQSAPQSIKSVIKFAHANVIPLLSYQDAKRNQTPEGDTTDYWILAIMPQYKDVFILPFAYAVKQQSSPPTLSSFIDMVIKIFKENANAPAGWPDSDSGIKGLIDQAKKGEPTIQNLDGNTIPNAGYWGYRYVYGEPKATPAAQDSSSSSSSSKKVGAISGGSGGSIGGGGGGAKCNPSLRQIPGGITETRCFN